MTQNINYLIYKLDTKLRIFSTETNHVWVRFQFSHFEEIVLPFFHFIVCSIFLIFSCLLFFVPQRKKQQKCSLYILLIENGNNHLVLWDFVFIIKESFTYIYAHTYTFLKWHILQYHLILEILTGIYMCDITLLEKHLLSQQMVIMKY